MSVPTPEPPQPSCWRRHGREGLSVWRLGMARLLPRWWLLLLIVGIGAVLAFTGQSWDDQLLEQIRQPDNTALNDTAKSLSHWGDVIWVVPLVLVLFGVGVKFGCPRWRQAAWACVFAVLASTVAVTLLRPTFGRARPHTNLGNFHGPTLESKFHGFPSGHATSAFAPAAAVLAAAPVVGVPCLIFAGGVSWSRLQLNRHRPLDVLTGAALGTLLGLCFGSAVPGARFRMRRKKRSGSR